MRTISTIYFLSLTIFAYSQDMPAIERDLLAKYRRIDYWWNYSGDNAKIHKEDSVDKANKVFQRALTAVASKYLASLSYPFKRLKHAGLLIATSDDGRFRVYSWDAEAGVSMHFSLNVYQWLGGRNVYAKAVDADSVSPGDPGVFCTPMYTLHTPANTYYLVVNGIVYSTSESYESIQAYCIDKQKLNDSVRIFKTQSGLVNSIGFDYDFFSVVDRPERPIHLIEFDPTKKIVRIPVVIEHGAVTRRWILYKWTGNYFERIR